MHSATTTAIHTTTSTTPRKTEIIHTLLIHFSKSPAVVSRRRQLTTVGFLEKLLLVGTCYDLVSFKLPTLRTKCCLHTPPITSECREGAPALGMRHAGQDPSSKSPERPRSSRSRHGPARYSGAPKPARGQTLALPLSEANHAQEA